MDLWRSINKKLNARLNGLRWALPKNTKLPLINGFSSHAVLIPLISSLCESVECSGKNKEQKRVKEKKRKEEKKKREKSKGIFLVKGERKC